MSLLPNDNDKLKADAAHSLVTYPALASLQTHVSHRSEQRSRVFRVEHQTYCRPADIASFTALYMIL